MSAEQWQILGIVLIAAGLVLLAVSQWLLSRWHKKMLEEL